MGGAGNDGWLRMALAASNPAMWGLQPLSGALCRRVPTATMAAVQALQDAGALLVGKATLHEIGEAGDVVGKLFGRLQQLHTQMRSCHGGGWLSCSQQLHLCCRDCDDADSAQLLAVPCPAGLGTTGLNLLTGTARNPHSTAHHTGGSSSGCAAIVAAGLCPFALGER